MSKYICDKEIAILMSVYNGAYFLSQQLDSLYKQTCSNWNLYVRDDGSTDSSLEIIKKYQERYSNLFLINDESHSGPVGSFMKLLDLVDSEYYMFCDQDDVWFSNKIEKSFKRIQLLEKINGKIPIIVHTDISLVDSKLKMLSESYWDEIHLDPNRMKNYNYLAICCYTTGCTMIYNKSAKEVSFPWNDKAIMHDWWVAINVIKTGIIDSVYSPTIYYRQHANNVMGVSYGRRNNFFYKLIKIKKIIIENYNLYKKLKEFNYGTIFKFLYYKGKILLMMRVNVKQGKTQVKKI
jgi:glycosyltransferase involved in cell wall biosynthesis